MGELARRRRARDVWVSRSHLTAFAVGGVLLVGLAFLLGHATGGGAATPPSRAAAVEVDESLVDLLARVDGHTVGREGVDTLTFPDTLAGVAADPPLPVPTPDEVASASVRPGVPGLRSMEVAVAFDAPAEARVFLAALAGVGRSGEVVVGEDETRVVLGRPPTLAEAEVLAAEITRVSVELGQSVEPEIIPVEP